MGPEEAKWATELQTRVEAQKKADLAAQAQTDEARLLIRHVAVSQQFVVFSYAGDLWRIARDGGTARRLTSGPEDDDFPMVSRDGAHVAFSRRGARSPWNCSVRMCSTESALQRAGKAFHSARCTARPRELNEA